MTTRQDGPAAYSPERSVTTAAESVRVEVVVDRDPDRAVEVHVFLDGNPVVAELTEVDPGRGGVCASGSGWPTST